MKTDYIETLYEDFNTKVTTIFKYLDIIKSGTTDTTVFLAKFVAAHEQLYDVLAQNQHQSTAAPDPQFAIEQAQRPDEVDASSVKDITEQITNATPMVEYKFEEILRNLQFLTQSFQNYQDITNKILEAWNDTIEGTQQ